MEESMSDSLVRIAQNDYMIDGHYLDDGKLLLVIAQHLAKLEKTISTIKDWIGD